MQTVIGKIGNLTGIVLPEAVLSHLGLTTGDIIDINLEAGRIIISPAIRHPREGWADAAASITAAHEDLLEWPEFANTGDRDL